MNQATKISLFAVILAVVAGGVWYARKPAPETTPVAEPTTPEVVTPGDNESGEVDTSDWKTYRNEEYGFELDYPNDWSVAEKDDVYTKEKFITFSKNLDGKYNTEDCPDCPTNSLAFFIRIYTNSDAKTYSEFTNLKSRNEIIATTKEVINITDDKKIDFFVISKENEEFYETLDMVKPSADAFFGSDKNSYMFYTAVDIPSGSKGQEIEVDVLRKALNSFKIID